MDNGPQHGLHTKQALLQVELKKITDRNKKPSKHERSKQRQVQ